MLILAKGNSLGTQSRVVDRVGYNGIIRFGKCVVWVYMVYNTWVW